MGVEAFGGHVNSWPPQRGQVNYAVSFLGFSGEPQLTCESRRTPGRPRLTLLLGAAHMKSAASIFVNYVTAAP